MTDTKNLNQLKDEWVAAEDECVAAWIARDEATYAAEVAIDEANAAADKAHAAYEEALRSQKNSND